MHAREKGVIFSKTFFAYILSGKSGPVLISVHYSGDKWSREACVAFEKLSSCAKWEVLMAKVMYYDDNGVPCIELIDTNTENVSHFEYSIVTIYI